MVWVDDRRGCQSSGLQAAGTLCHEVVWGRAVPQGLHEKKQAKDPAGQPAFPDVSSTMGVLKGPLGIKPASLLFRAHALTD